MRLSLNFHMLKVPGSVYCLVDYYKGLTKRTIRAKIYFFTYYETIERDEVR